MTVAGGCQTLNPCFTFLGLNTNNSLSEGAVQLQVDHVCALCPLQVRDLRRLLELYQRWHPRLFNHCDYNQFETAVEKMSGTNPVKVRRLTKQTLEEDEHEHPATAAAAAGPASKCGCSVVCAPAMVLLAACGACALHKLVLGHNNTRANPTFGNHICIDTCVVYGALM
jgi:hypothetical protein